MQPPNAPPRDELTSAQVVALIQDAPALTVGYGAELMGMDLQVIEDISDDVVGGSVTRNNYATLHGTASLTITRELDWGRAIVRPYMTITDGLNKARFNLGAYFTSTQGGDVAETLPVFEVTGFDILHQLTDLVGESYVVDAGTTYLIAVESILAAQGYVGYVIDQTAQATVVPSARVWEIDERTTWLTIVNDLLAAIGYRGVWSDWDGRVRCDAYVSPSRRAPEWTYTVDIERSMLTPRRVLERDLFEVPNRWVAVRSNNVDGPAPIEGDGVWTYVNENVGPTSLDARGRIVTRVLPLDAADQASLMQQAQVSIDADMRVTSTLKLGTAPNPLHWHFDRLSVNDPALGALLEVQGNTWTLPLTGGDMTHEWNVL